MDQALFLETITPGLTGLLVLTFVCVVLGVFIGVRALTHGRTAPLIGGLVIGPLGLAAFGLVLWNRVGDQMVDGTSEAAWQGIFGMIGPLLMVPFLALVPVLLHGLLAAVAGARGPNRRWWVPIAALLPLAVAVVAPTLGGWLAGGGLFPLGVLRTVLYAVVGLLTLPALLGGGDAEGGGPEAGAAAGVTFATFVALGEASGRALFWFLMLGPFTTVVTADGRLEMVQRVRDDLLSTAEVWSAIAVLAATAVGALALVGAARGGSRTVHAILGGLWLVIAPLPLVLGDVTDVAWARLAYTLEATLIEAPSAPPAPGAD